MKILRLEDEWRSLRATIYFSLCRLMLFCLEKRHVVEQFQWKQTESFISLYIILYQTTLRTYFFIYTIQKQKP